MSVTTMHRADRSAKHGVLIKRIPLLVETRFVKFIINLFSLLRRDIPKKHLVFVHIPKTAGTSFRAALQRSFGGSKVCFDYQSKGSSRLVSELVTEKTSKISAQPSFRDTFESEGYMTLSGHFPAQKYKNVFAFGHFVAFVREPIARAESLYLHRTRKHGLESGFSEFIESGGVRNAQSRYLADVPWPAFAMLGVTERYEESVQAINREFGTRFKVLAKNRAPSKPASNACLRLNESELHVLKHENQRDYALFESVNRYLDIRQDCHARNVPFVKGCYNVDAKGSISGWLVSENSASEAIISRFWEQPFGRFCQIELEGKVELPEGGCAILFRGTCSDQREIASLSLVLDLNRQPILRTQDAELARYPF